MKICPKCGTSLEDHMNFCNVCGQNQSVVPQPQIPAEPQSAYAPVSSAPYKPSMGSIVLFIVLGNILTFVISFIVNLVLPMIGVSVAWVYRVLNIVYTVIFALVTLLGFVIYNNGCKKNNHAEKMLPIFWVALPVVARFVVDFVVGALWGIVLPLLYQNLGYSVAGIINLVMSFVLLIIRTVLNCLISSLVLKAVVKNK